MLPHVRSTYVTRSGHYTVRDGCRSPFLAGDAAVFSLMSRPPPGREPRASGLGHDSRDPRALTRRTAAPRSPGTQPASSPPGDQTPFGEPCGGLGLSPNHTTCPAHAAERPGALSTDAEKRVTVWPRDPRPGRRELTLGRVLMSAEWGRRPRLWSDLRGPGEGRRPARLRLAPAGPLRCCSCDPAGSFAVRALVLGPDHP